MSMNAGAATTTMDATRARQSDGAFHVEHGDDDRRERVELARYTVSNAGERVIYGQRTRGGEAIVIDMPADENGRVYLVERHVEHDGNLALQAMLIDYRDQARRLDDIPMRATILARQLGRLVSR